MKKRKRTTTLLTLLLLFMFAIFGGGTILSALGIEIPFLMSSSNSSVTSQSVNSQPNPSDTIVPADIQITNPQVTVSSQMETNSSAETITKSEKSDKDSPYVVHLSDNTGTVSATGTVDKNATSSSPSHETGSASDSTDEATGSASGSLPSNTGTKLPSTRTESSTPSGGGGSRSVAVQSITVDQSDVTINRKNTLQLVATVTPQSATKKTVSWASSNKDVATVDSTGKVIGIGAGTATITASADKKTAACDVTVVVLMDGITLNHSELSIDKGSTEQLTAKITPEDTTEDKAVTWTSSSPEIVSVDSSGKLTALKPGKATVKASAAGASANCEITVISPLTGIALDKTTLTLNRHATDRLTVSFLPDDTTSGREVTWSSSAPDIADVDQQGNVIAYGKGAATITAQCGEFTATCNVTTIALIEGIYLDQPEMTVDRGRKGQLIASIVPMDTTEDKTIVWTSSNPDIAAVDSTGNVSAIHTGTATIAARVGEHTAICNVTVVALIHNISLNKTELMLDRGISGQLAVSYDPADTTEDKTITWTSSNPDVATVNAAGNVTAVQIGTATITAQVGTHTTTCSVTVVALIHNISLNKPALTLDRGTGEQLELTIDPPDTTEDKTAIWTSSNPSVATVDSTGKVTAVQIGTATITAKMGTHTTTCNVTVVALIHSISVNKNKLTLDRGTGEQLELTIDPSDTTEDKTVVWSTSNPDVATVDSSGKVTAIQIGTATITATIAEHTSSCAVNVVALIKSIALDKTSLTVDRGTTGQLTISYEPSDTTEDKTATWTSSNPSVATVDATGKVTAVQIGSATITAKVGEHTTTCNVTVVALIKSISLDKSTLTLDRGTTEQLAVSINPSDTTESKTVTWSSSNTAVATVDSSGMVTAVQIGSATITAKVGTHTTSCTVNVVALIHKVTLDKSSASLSKGETQQLTVSIDPPDTTEDKTVTWTSSNPKVATVNSEGVVSALTAGETTITAKVGSKTASCATGVGVKYTFESGTQGNWIGTKYSVDVFAGAGSLYSAKHGGKEQENTFAWCDIVFEKPISKSLFDDSSSYLKFTVCPGVANRFTKEVAFRVNGSKSTVLYSSQANTRGNEEFTVALANLGTSGTISKLGLQLLSYHPGSDLNSSVDVYYTFYIHGEPVSGGLLYVDP